MNARGAVGVALLLLTISVAAPIGNSSARFTAARSGAHTEGQSAKAADLFQQALSKERAEGRLEEAVALYERVVTEFSADRLLAARALLQMGRCYDKLGKQEAKRTYERLVREYPDQRALADEARARLVALDAPRVAASVGIVTRQIAGATDNSGAPSPDGRLLSGTDWSTGDLVLQELATRDVHRVARPPTAPDGGVYTFGSRISPDGRKIAYVAFASLPDASAPRFDLRIVNLDGSQPRVLYHNPEIGFIGIADWSQDGRLIAATFFDNDGGTRIALVSVDTGRVTTLKSLDWRFPDRLRFSPDGRYLAYDIQTGEESLNRDIFLLAADGSREVPLVRHQADDTVVGWIPRSNRLLFTSNRTGSIDLWSITVNLSGGPAAGAPEVVKRDVGAIWPMGFTHAGTLFYAVSSRTRDACVVDFDPGAVAVRGQPVCVSEEGIGSNYEPFWSPDGGKLGYVSERVRLASTATTAYGRPLLVVDAFDGSARRELAPKLTMIRRPRWGPDGHTILVRAYDANRRPGLFTVDARSAEVKLVVREGHDPVWLPDGGSVLYRSGENNSPDVGIWVRRLDTGEEREIRHGPAQNLALSPDGRWLAFVGKREGGGAAIEVTSPAGGAAREVYGDAAWRDPGDSRVYLTWLPDSRHLLFTRNDMLWALPLDGGDPRPLGLALKGRATIQLSPDGRRLAFTSGEPTSEVWVMENILPSARAATPARRSGAKR